MSMTSRHIRSLALPLLAVLVIPFFLVATFTPFGIRHSSPVLYLQIPFGILFSGLGLLLLVLTIRSFARIGKGTLAPWDPPRNLVTEGVYGFLRNPMISGGSLAILGESILLGSWVIFGWFALFVAANTIYFKRVEEPGLVKRFGDEYEHYRADVPMWIPRFGAKGETR